MNISIRQEVKEDYKTVFLLVEEAFKTMKYSNGKEQFLVEQLRKSDAFIPELSLVAEYEGNIVGHILLTKIHIQNDEKQFNALALAPVSVLPAFHKQSIGSQLINEAHHIAHQLGHERVILIGHADYYPRFGYEMTSKYGITFPFPVREESAMVLSLTENGLNEVSGEVMYSPPFLE